MQQEEKLKCLICSKTFKHLGSHIWQKHHILARDYKEEFGLPYNMSLITKEIYDKKVAGFERNREVCLKNIQSNESVKYQFKKGQTGQRRISDHERKTIIERIKKVNESHQGLLESCPVCNMKFNHLESHLYTKHRLIRV